MKIFLLLAMLHLWLPGLCQNIGINVASPKATLEIKSQGSSSDSNAILISNITNDTLFKMNRAGTATIGSIQKDFGQLQIISNAKLGYSNLQLTGTNVFGNSGIHFSDLIFNGTSSNKYWRVVSRLYGTGASPESNHSKNSLLTFHSDSLLSILSLTGDGKVGLNTAAPAAYLEIRNDASDATGIIPHLKLVGTGLANRSYVNFSTADNAHNWFMRGQYINDIGNFTIGADGTTLLAMGNDGQTSLGGIGGLNSGQVNIPFNSTTAKAHLSLYETDANDYARIMFQNGSSLSDNWQIAGLINTTAANSKLNFYNNVSGDVMSLSGDGKVGIGTTSPLLGGLVVNSKAGAVNALFGSNSTGVAIESGYPGLGLNSYYNAGRKLIANGYAGYIGMDPTNGKLIFANTAASGTAGAATAISDRMYIINTGEVGINKNPGTSNSDSKLQVKQTGLQNAIGIEAPGSTNHWDFYLNAGNNLALYYNGAIKGSFDNTGGGYTAASDRALKKDITKLPALQDKLLQLQAYQYHYLDNTVADAYSYGFMAQEVAQLFPEAVRTISMKDNTTKLGINYQYFTVLAIKGLQEQQEKITALEQRLEKLEKRMAQ